MATGGTATFDFKGNTKDLDEKIKNIPGKVQNSGNTVKNILTSLGIAKLVSKAMSTISNSIDGAVKRVDTMNNFPKVMKNMKISTKESEEAINTLSDKLTGLPTTLDSATASVQRLTTKTGDVKKSTKLFLAMNNAILAGGATMDVQSSALEQMSQAYAKGKPDMVEWKSMLNAMPAQLKQVSQALGYDTVDAMGEALRSTKNTTFTMDDLLGKMVELNTEGVDGFANFEQQARDATGGIGTSMINLQTAITRGLANVMNSVDQALSEAGLGGIAGVVQSATKIINESFKKVIAIMDKVDWKKVVNDVKLLWTWIKKLSPIIIGVTSAMVAYNVALKIQKGLQIVNGIVGTATAFIQLLPAIKSVKDAMLLLNMVFAVNPFVLIIAGIVGLIAGLVVLYAKCEWFRNMVNNVFGKIINFVKNNWKLLLIFLANPFLGGFLLIRKYWDQIKAFLSSAIKNVIDFVKNNWKMILLFLVNPFAGAFALLYSKCEWFKNIVNNFVKTVLGFLDKIPYYLGVLVGMMLNALFSLPGKVSQIWNDVKTKFMNALTTLKAQAPGKMNEIKNTIINAIKNLPAKMLNIGSDIVKGIWNGINSAKNWLSNKTKDFAKGIVAGLKKSLKIGSPSKLMASEIGQWIPKGIAVGINANTDSVSKAMKNINKDLFDTTNYGLSNTTIANASANFSPNVNVVVNSSYETDPLGLMVNSVKTFSNGAKNDFNYGR